MMRNVRTIVGMAAIGLVVCACSSETPGSKDDRGNANDASANGTQQKDSGLTTDRTMDTDVDAGRASGATRDSTTKPVASDDAGTVNNSSAQNNTSGTATTSDDNTTRPSGNGPMLGSCPLFPADNAWNTDISAAPVHPNSDAFIDSIGRTTRLHPDFGTEWEGAPIGIPYTVVDSSQPEVNIKYTAYGDESDPGPMPIPLEAPIEGGEDGDGDRHTLVIDEDSCTLYELYRAFPRNGGFEADSGTVWDLRRNEDHPEGCTSADAAGLPIFPGLVRYDEVVEQKEVLHALRFTVARSQRGYIYPARHYASSNTDPNLAPMGLRVRMKANYDCGSYSSDVRVLCTALKRFGMIVADNGSNWYVSGAPDPRWSDDNLRDLRTITGDAFEVVDTGPIVTNAPECSL